MEENQSGRKWLTKKDAMRYLSIAQRTLENWTNDGTLRSYKVHGRVYFDQGEIDQDIQRHEKFGRRT